MPEHVRLAEVPSHDQAAERAVLTAALTSDSGFDDVSDIIDSEDFYLDCNRRIWEAICSLDDEQAKVDAVTVARKLKATGRLGQMGGTKYLLELTEQSSHVLHASGHAKIIADLARQRRIVFACSVAVTTGRSEIEDIEKYAQSVAESVYVATDVGSARDKPETLGQLVPVALKEITDRTNGDYSNIRHIPTGFMELSNKMSGGWTSNLYVIAGRPGMGKTAFALQECVEVAKQKRSAVFVSGEMPKEQLVLRLLSQESKIDYVTLAKGKVAPLDWSRLTSAAARISQLPLSIAYRPGATVPEIRSLIRRETAKLCAARDVKKGIACIDYLQILNGQRAKGDSRENEVAEMSRRFMAMTGEFGMPILLLSQLNREVEKRPNKRPELSDLRDSGSIEQDAYGVLFLYRDDYYNKNSNDPGTVEVGLAKHRNGPTGMVKLRFAAHTMSFIEIEGQGNYPEEDSIYDN